MYLAWGSYVHALNEAGVSIQKTPVFNEGGERRGYLETWQVQGFLQAATQLAVDAVIILLKLAYSQDGRDLKLLYDDGTPTNHQLLSRQCIGGTRVTAGPSFPTWEGAEFSTYRSYTLTVEGEVFDSRISLLAWHESLSFSGGGPLTGHLQTLTGPPQKQLLAQQTVYRATQSGNAIGFLAYPIPPGALFPDDLKEAPKVTFESPKRSGPRGRPTFTEWPVSWVYEFERIGPYSGQPHRWPADQ